MCNDTTQLLRDPWFWGGEMLKLVLAPSSTIFNLLLLYLLAQSRPLHVNVRNLLGNISACLAVNGVYLTAKGVVTIASVSHCRPCWTNASVHPQLCSFQTGVMMTTVFSAIASFFALQVERFYAAMQVSSYENRRKATCSVAVLFLIWTCTILCTSAVVATIPNSLTLPHCNEWLAMHPVAFAAGEAIIPTMQVFGISLFVGVWMYGRQQLSGWLWSRSHRSFSIPSRATLERSVATAEMLLPSMISHAVSWCLVTVANVFVPTAAPMDVPGPWPGPDGAVIRQLVCFQYFFYVVFLLQALLHPLFCMWNLSLVVPDVYERLPIIQKLFTVTTEGSDRDRTQAVTASLGTNYWPSSAKVSEAAAAVVGRRKDSPRPVGQASTNGTAQTPASNVARGAAARSRAINAHEYVPLKPISEAAEEEQSADDEQDEKGNDEDDDAIGDEPDMTDALAMGDYDSDILRIT